MTFALALVALAGTSSATVLENDAIAVEFDDLTGGAAVRRIVNKVANGLVFVQGDYALPGLWCLEFVSKNGWSEVVTAEDSGVRPELSMRSGEATFRWKDVRRLTGRGTFDVTAKVILEGRGARWTIAVENRNGGWKLAETRYPVIARTVSPADPSARLLLPSRSSCGGRLYVAAEYAQKAEFRDFVCPADVLPMCAMLRTGGGLYAALPEGGRLSVSPCGTLTVVSAEGVPVTLEAFGGDWWSAARIHRVWALRQPWCARGRLSERTDIPDRILKANVWIVDDAAQQSALARLEGGWSDFGHLVVGSTSVERRTAACGLPYALEPALPEAEDVPLFPAVYSGYALSLGCRMPEPLECWEIFRSYAPSFVFGGVTIGFSAASAAGEDGSDKHGIFGQFGRFRRDHADYLVYGTLLGEVRIDGGAPEHVGGAFWLNADGRRRAAILYSGNRAVCDVTFSFPGANCPVSTRLSQCGLTLAEER